MRNKTHLTSLLFVTVCLALSLPAAQARNFFSPSLEDEKKVGAEAAKEIEAKSKIVTGERATELATIGAKVIAATGQKEVQFTFKVIQDKQVNAFAIPGGYVYFYTGLLDALAKQSPNKEDATNEIAAVLAHEVTHVTQHHWAKQVEAATKRQYGLLIVLGLLKANDTWQNVASWGDTLMTLRYSRKEETEADRLGVKWMYLAGYDPQGMVNMLKILQKLGGDTPSAVSFLGDHPLTKDRINQTEKEIAAIKKTPRPTPPPALSSPTPSTSTAVPQEPRAQ